MKTLTLTDESMAGDILNKIALQFESEYVTVKEVIEARLEVEIKRFEQQRGSYTNGLVLPTNLEQRLNKQQKPKVDPEKQLYVALHAFENNGFILLVDDEQAENVQQKVLVDETTRVSFIKLVPLVGG